MTKMALMLATAVPLSLAASACADWDNPVALSEFDPMVEFEIEAPRIETFEEVEIHVDVSESGTPMGMHRSQLEVQHVESGETQVMEMEPEGDGYAAHVQFFAEGEHHLHFIGMPKGHTLLVELGEHEVEVHRQHRVVGPFWVELEVTPAPVLEGATAHLRAIAFEVLNTSTPGDPVTGLKLEMAVHAPDGHETSLAVQEEAPGEYEGEYTFGEAGPYELEVEILVAGVSEEAEFHIPVSSGTGDDVTDDDGGHGHG